MAHGIEVTASDKDSILAVIEKARFRDEPQLRLTRTAENEEDELVRARKRKSPAGAGGGGSRKGSKGKLLESDRSTVCVACSFLPGHVLASNLF